MSVIGRGTKSLRKQDVAEQKSIALGLKKLVFAHKANAGEAGINVTSLVAPPEMTANGFVNPSTSAITRVNIYQNKNNVKIVSSLAGLLVPYLSYTVNSSTYIAFKDFTAAQDEIFTVYLDEVPTTSLSVVDGAPIIASGTLLAGQTDFNIGVPIEINKYASQQIGAVMVYVDRGLQYRKVGNVTSGDGDYIEVPVAGGLGSLIRFDASGVDRFVTVVSNGVVAERPSGSMAAMIENVQGQIDQMVPTVAALAGVPESTFQIAPNNVDLKQFGDVVLENNRVIELMKTVSVPAVTDWQQYNLTITGSISNPTKSASPLDDKAYWRRVGDSMEIKYDYRHAVAGSPGSGSYYFSLPTGYQIDANKMATINLTALGGVGTITVLQNVTVYQGQVFYGTSTSVYAVVFNDTQTMAEVGTTGAGIGALNSVAIRYTLNFRVPIQGWSSTQTIAEILGI